MQFSEIRVRTRIHPDELEAKKGLVLESGDLDIQLTGPTIVKKATGERLATYLPGVLKDLSEPMYDILHGLKGYQTDNRGLASGSGRGAMRAGRELAEQVAEGQSRTRSMPISSAIVGSFDAKPPKNYCRLTAWTGKEWEQYRGLFPYFQRIGAHFAEHVPDRYAAQMDVVSETNPDWVIEGTPFSTATVNNSYPTGVHTDSGDLESGFSNLAVIRRGNYSGGIFTFAEYRIGVDMQDGDLLLMDAHEWHGNTSMWCNVCGDRIGPGGRDDHDVTCGVERISTVAYYRTKVAKCGSAEEEQRRAIAWRERTIALGGGAVDPEVIEQMAAEAAGG
ncbi:MAG TPA: hypothetical protein VI341_13775 [Actinomycetota bacterium]